MSKQPLVITTFSPLARAFFTASIKAFSEITPKSVSLLPCTASASSISDKVDVPNLPTTTPAAAFARAHASSNDLPAATEAASTEITVSPAPVTSYTSFACVGRWNGSSPRRINVIPCSLRVTSRASKSNSSTSASAFSTSS